MSAEELSALAAKAGIPGERVAGVLDGHSFAPRDIARVMKALPPLEADLLELTITCRRLPQELHVEAAAILRATASLLEHGSLPELSEAIRSTGLLQAEAEFGSPEQRARAQAIIEVQHAVLTFARLGGLQSLTGIRDVVKKEDRGEAD